MNMNLKGIMQTLGAQPGQVVSNPYVRAFAPTPVVKEAEEPSEDHEVSMANNSLDTIIKMATELKAKMGENEKDIPAWIQDHITNAENYISQASSNYHEYGTNESINEVSYNVKADYGWYEQLFGRWHNKRQKEYWNYTWDYTIKIDGDYLAHNLKKKGSDYFIGDAKCYLSKEELLKSL